MTRYPGSCRVSRLRTSDIDQARIFVSRYFFPHSLDLLHETTTLAASFAILQFGPLTVGDLRYGADVTIRYGQHDSYQVDVLLSGHLVARQAGRPLVATATHAAVFGPVGDTILDRWSADCRVLALKIDRVALDNHLEQLLDMPVRSPLQLAPTLDTTQGPGRSWSQLLRLLADEISNRDGLVYRSFMADRFCLGLLGGLLVAADHPYRDELERPRGPCAPRGISRAINAIHAQPAFPFTAVKLAEVAGTSVRALQEGFQRHVGISPTAYLRQVRLARAHHDLQQADPGHGAVAEIAYRWGFTHLGRFAAVYRAKYGVSPSATRRCA